MLSNRTILEHSLEKIIGCGHVADIWVAIKMDDPYWPVIEENLKHSVNVVEGGAERADSVLNAIAAIPGAQADDWVLVHDAVRPLVDSNIINDLLDSLTDSDAGAILAQPVYETVKLANDDRTVSKTLDRSQLWTAQTPQVFRYGLLKDALESTRGDRSITDEASAMEACGHQVRLIEGHRYNIKITCREDLVLAEQLMKLEA
ncbi:UNVERIFIED_CONTAM: hypothetical protein GTU68_037030 [Idotea baltica]|nr:hypothetical protein [Idotea baltica]